MLKKIVGTTLIFAACQGAIASTQDSLPINGPKFIEDFKSSTVMQFSCADSKKAQLQYRVERMLLSTPIEIYKLDSSGKVLSKTSTKAPKCRNESAIEFEGACVEVLCVTTDVKPLIDAIE